VAGIIFWQKINLQPNPADNFLIKKLLEGTRRGGTSKDARLPITGGILRQLVATLPMSTSSAFEATMFETAFLLAFFGFLRLGEFTVYSKAQPPATGLLGGDVQIRQAGAEGTTVLITLRRSKNNHSGQPQIISIAGIPGDRLCPVQAVQRFQATRPTAGLAFFCHFDHSPLTRHEFQAVLKRTVDLAGIGGGFSSHSFRIGAATSAAVAGYSESQIKAFGRWRSGAYARYIRPPTIPAGGLGN
jgi:hypothetical protein